ncbi:MAG TPA: methyl-accepting chemotaxis protein [Firmicutes bacterium]|nr:methyl-accepting chemotaxis protein [Bacillota bacterium]
MGIRVKIALAMVVLLVVSVTFIGVFAYSKTSAALQEQKETEFINNVLDLKENIDTSIEDTTGLLSFITSTPAAHSCMADGDYDKMEQLLKGAGETIQQVETIMFANMDGFVMVSSGGELDYLIDLSERDYFQEAAGGNASVGEIVSSKVTGNEVFTIAVPMMTDMGVVEGVLVATLNFDDVVGKHVQKVRVGESGYAWMVDSQGLVISHPDEEHVLKTNLIEEANEEFSQMVREMAGGATGESFYTFEGVQKFSAYSPAGIWSLAFTMDVSEYMAPARQIRNSIIIVAIIFIIAGLMIANYISGQIGNPIIAMMQAMKRAEKGDLTVSVLVKGSDEIGQLSQSFNAMIVGQKNIITKVLESASSVASASQELNAAVEESNATMEEISTIVESVIALKAKGIAAASNEASQSGRSTREIAEKGATDIREAAGGMQLISNSTKEVGEVITELFGASEKIGMIIETITNIAEQTNMLALNAAIEAARAGEQGQGFTVVAEEVRKLAEGSSDAAGEIAGLIMNVQEITENAVKKMSEAGGTVQDGVGLAKAAQEGFDNIRQAIGQVVLLIEQMATAAREQSASIEEISSSTEEQTAVLEEVTATTGQLANMAEELNDLVSDFKIA